MSSSEFEMSLQSRGAAYPIVQEALRQQELHPPRSKVGRLFGANPLPPHARSLYRGAVGELGVADVLDQLGEDWTIIHSVPVGRGGADLDHIAIGPPGVFTVKVVNLAGSVLWIGGSVFLFDGHREPFIPEAETEALRASKLLSDATGVRIEVIPCIVTVDPRSLTVARAPRRVAILTPRQLRPWLKELPVVHSPEQLQALRESADRPETWEDHERAADESRALVEKFRHLQREVSSAQVIRTGWIVAVVIGMWALGIVAGVASGLFQL